MKYKSYHFHKKHSKWYHSKIIVKAFHESAIISAYKHFIKHCIADFVYFAKLPALDKHCYVFYVFDYCSNNVYEE